MCEIYDAPGNRMMSFAGGRETLVICNNKVWHLYETVEGYEHVFRCPDYNKELVTAIMKDEDPCTFENFDQDINDFNAEILEIKNFLFNKDKKKLLMIGDIGAGKTHLCKAFVHLCIENGESCIMHSETDLADIFKRYVIHDETEGLNKIYRCKYFVIDDLARHYKFSDFFNQQFSNFLDKYKGSLVITMNVGLETMAKRDYYSDTIRSRLGEKAKKVIFVGEDYRPYT